jgi:hypothetical protein
MIMVGEAAGEPVAAAAKPTEKMDAAVDSAPLEYPFPGGRVPIIRASDRVVVATPLSYPAPSAAPKPAEAAPPSTEVSFTRVSASIIAMAAPEPAISFEEVASVDESEDEEAARRAESYGPGPTVIRGGVVGESGSVSTPAVPMSKPAAVQRGPATGGTRSASAGGTPPAAGPAQESPKQDLPIPSPTPAAPPADIIPEAKIR